MCDRSFLSEKSAIWKFAHFSHIRSFRKSECAIAHFFHIFKERKNVQSHIRTFLKSEITCDRTFAHCQRAKMCKCAKMCKKRPNFEIALFTHFKEFANCSFEKGHCAKMCKKKCESALFSHIFTHSLISKERLCDHTFSHFFKERKNVRSDICTFSKSEKMCDRTFAHFQRAKKCAMCKCAIAQP